MKGTPEGKSRIRVGERAPLETSELREAHASGKAIILMFGNPWHCLYCERTWFNIKEVLPRYENDVAFVMVAAQRVKFWEPPDENVRLAKRYGVIGEPWVFLVDKAGVVRKIFVGFTERGKIEAELTNLLDPLAAR
ncbi:MAG: thioredoxin family protein [Candidatus Rokubacteria bacterium]|nr:thioredoxin family protein [Candidatus Rokubacteria bacterium]